MNSKQQSSCDELEVLFDCPDNNTGTHVMAECFNRNKML